VAIQSITVARAIAAARSFDTYRFTNQRLENTTRVVFTNQEGDNVLFVTLEGRSSSIANCIPTNPSDLLSVSVASSSFGKVDNVISFDSSTFKATPLRNTATKSNQEFVDCS
jgi:hypothetical protein